MKMRLFSKIFPLGMAVAAAGLAGWACSAPDPGELGNTDPDKPPGGKFDAGQPGPRPDAGPGGDGGSQGSTDPFADQPAYTKIDGDSSIRPGGHSTLQGNNPVGENCFNGPCHGAGGNGPTFAIGGTIYQNDQGVNPAGAGVEVRIRSLDGSYAKSTYTDQYGNFRIKLGNDTFPAQAYVSIRNGKGVSPMSNQLSNADGACSKAGNCHGGGSTKKVWIAP
ncbi:hypothetical protein LVJ94_52330 [Pendulispora rubella]|uniref:Carboxypeptidase regulatory-like domain-containing protein n=1 Tax=Pendulispora rubella TaxID=2741070 RepID=A0ABZ2L698_9BACT